MLTLPQLAYPKKDLNILRPLVFPDISTQLIDLENCQGYIAGTLDDTFALKSELFDVLLNLKQSQISISDHATTDLRMGTLHKEIADSIESAAQLEESFLISSVHQKTKEILSILQNSMSYGKVSDELLMTNIPNASRRRWYSLFARAEGLL